MTLELAGIVGLGGVVLGVLITHFTKVSANTGRIETLESEVDNIKMNETRCRAEILGFLKSLQEGQTTIQQQVARIEGMLNGKLGYD